MATMTQPVATSAGNHRHPVTTAAHVLLFWLGAAAAVAIAHVRFDRVWPSGAAAAGSAAIMLAALGYTRLRAPRAGVTHALGVGIAWLLLGILFEMVMQPAHVRYAILGSPERPLLRNLFLFLWIFAPAVFARREPADADPS